MVKVALDMDGVLVNFNKGASEKHGIALTEEQYRCSLQKHWGLTQKDFWSKCSGFEFWDNLEWMPDGKDILSTVVELVGKENIAICTSPAKDPMCLAGKYNWVRREIPWLERRMIITPIKEWCASKWTVLVDDNPEKIDNFVKAGGKGCLVPRLWNKNADRTAVPFIEGFIQAVKYMYDLSMKADNYEFVRPPNVSKRS
jgi:5'(3')-deoxyribonucleotidase